MLNLSAATDPAWTDCALAHLDQVLVDHAHCEQKAAGMAVRLSFRYASYRFLLEPLSRIAREELVHFEEVLRLLSARGIPFRRLRPGPYAGRLRGDVRAREPGRLVDTLLCCALIEARSCERFQLLAKAVSDPELAAFYGSLLEAEARHHGIYVDLAREVAGDGIRERLQELAAAEAEIVSTPPVLPRMHG
jgi:tRNA-(ms[2]io[6]A)-hydroxylase